MLGNSEKLQFTPDENGLKVELPTKNFGDLPFVLKIKGLKF